MELLKNIRAYEDVFFEDPEENPDTPRFRVWFDDKHIEEYLAKVGNAIDRAQANEQMAREADTPEKAAEASAAQPTYGMPESCRSPCTVPSSPFLPCSAGITASTRTVSPEAGRNRP